MKMLNKILVLCIAWGIAAAPILLWAGAAHAGTDARIAFYVA